MREWYSQHLGLADKGYGAMLPWREHDDPQKEHVTVWTIFPGSTDYIPATQPFMINYIVDDHERLRDWDILGSEAGEDSPNCNVFLLRVVVFPPRKHRAIAFVGESKMLRIPFAHLITMSGFEEDTADSKDTTALLHFDRRLRLFRLRRFHFLSS